MLVRCLLSYLAIALVGLATPMGQEVCAQTPKAKYQLLAREGQLADAAISSDGRMVAAMSEACVVKVVFTGTDKELTFTTRQRSFVNHPIAFSPDHTLLAAAVNDHVFVWELPSGKLRHDWVRQEKRPDLPKGVMLIATVLQFSPDSRRLLTGTIAEGHVWDVSK